MGLLALSYAEVLEASIQLKPDFWEAYYHLGYVYGGMGRLAEGIAAFEKTLERRPDFPEVKIELARQRRALAAVQAAQQAAQKRRIQNTTPSPAVPR